MIFKVTVVAFTLASLLALAFVIYRLNKVKDERDALKKKLHLAKVKEEADALRNEDVPDSKSDILDGM